MNYTLTTIRDSPHLRAQLGPLDNEGWPPFMTNDPVADKHWPFLCETLPQYQLMLSNKENQVIAAGYTVPLYWDGTIEGLPESWEDALIQGTTPHQNRKPNTLSALAIVIRPSFRGQKLSTQIVQGMRALAQHYGYTSLIAPVRPSLKSRYPLIPMEDYIRWTREDGLPFDPWMRVHARLGARILKVAPRSMVIPGTVQDWERWSGMKLPQSGAYIIPEALVPLELSHERNEGIYIEPNVWMQHQIS
ncbi:hypothetical protein EI42_02221 [Thermosporothrix hazakensis]|jgi:GNAT superfamily N-acetyltransferase|uniref:Acetyltransferase (GNAT) family protein n=1 Tax=Thermosporothrix hazakensis TaxID=644383 RepID=A0A326U7L2_THEHA|nr:GNAT family N-acetyltransferase [Thermosporothrix hazakensis]PZW31124.1 hypothetical protein EI42_02221 [Thermosporothrix hazakensis]GCE50963.1 transferase [Thermosporothrix hazakensis]